MKAIFKKAIAFVLVIAMAVTTGVMLPQSTVEVQAAKAKVYMNPYNAKVVTYKPGDGYSKYYTTLSIMGCSKKSQIKKLKSSKSTPNNTPPRRTARFILPPATKRLIHAITQATAHPVIRHHRRVSNGCSAKDA